MSLRVDLRIYHGSCARRNSTFASAHCERVQAKREETSARIRDDGRREPGGIQKSTALRLCARANNMADVRGRSLREREFELTETREFELTEMK